MTNLFEHTSAYWAKYASYEWRKAADGKEYLLPTADAKASVYNTMPLADQMVLDAVNIGLLVIHKSPEKKIKAAIHTFVCNYGLLGMMTAFPTTPNFVEYEKVYPNMTVRKNMSFALETKKTPKEEITRRVDEMAKMLSIEPLLDRKPAELSGGQRQRVALGRAMVRDPNVFMLDEPLGNLDAKLREQVRYELKKIQRKLGVTTVYVTHDQTEAMTMADHIVLMNGGHIVQEGTPSDLYDHPCNLFAAVFLGTPKINTFDVTVAEMAGKYFFVKPEFTLPVPADMVECVKPYAGKTIILGVRPSDLLLEQNGGEGCITGTVDGVEPLGEAYLVYLNVGGQVIVFKYNGEKSDFSGKLSLRPNAAKLHLFDKDTEKRIND